MTDNPIDDKLVEAWRLIMERYCCSTYPKKTLKRRLKACTARDLHKIDECVNEIDEIISIRAEKNDDPWP